MTNLMGHSMDTLHVNNMIQLNLHKNSSFGTQKKHSYFELHNKWAQRITYQGTNNQQGLSDYFNQNFNMNSFGHLFKGHQNCNLKPFLDEMYIQGQLALIINICNFITRDEILICYFHNFYRGHFDNPIHYFNYGLASFITPMVLQIILDLKEVQ